MRARTRVHGLALAVAFAATAGAFRADAQQPTPLPFDATLSIYAGHTGTWLNYTTLHNEAAEVEASLAAYEPQETPGTPVDVEAWGEHAINAPGSPPGWRFFSPAEGEPMQLRLIVRDMQNRLGRAVVTNWETGEGVGTLNAAPGGGEISGLVNIDPEIVHFAVQVKTPANATLFRATGVQGRVDRAIAWRHCVRWSAVNRGGPAHTECPGPSGPPWGDPRQMPAGVLAALAPNGEAYGCATLDFTNDTADLSQRMCPYSGFMSAGKTRDTIWAWGGTELSPEANQTVREEIEAARAPYENPSPVAWQPFMCLPYSRGTAHWGFTVVGEVWGVIYIPYRGSSIWGLQFKTSADFEASTTGAVGKAVGQGNFAPELATTLRLEFSPQERKKWRIYDPVAVGDVWGYRLTAGGPPSAYPNNGITEEVTLELNGNVTPPNGNPGPLAGTGTAVRGAADTNPAPPWAGYPLQRQLTFGADGRCVVALQKGWNWSATGQPPQYYLPPQQATTFATPVGVPQRITCALNVLLTLTVTTSAEATVQMERQVGGNWQAAAPPGGDTVLENGANVWRVTNLPLGQYRVRAKRRGAQAPYSGWTEFTATATLQQSVGPIVCP